MLNAADEPVFVVNTFVARIAPSFGAVTVNDPVAGANDVPPARSSVPSDPPLATFVPRVSRMRNVLLATRSARIAIRSTRPLGTLLIVNVGADWFAEFDSAVPIDTRPTSFADVKPEIVPVSDFVPGTGLSVHSAAAAAVTSDRP